MAPSSTSYVSLTLLLAPLACRAAALRSFTTNCTLPKSDPTFYYVSTPNVRGSLQIIWTNLSTLILCTWSVLHLSVPKQYLENRHRLWDDIKRSRVWPSLGWSLVTILAPEYTLVNSAKDKRASQKALEKLIANKQEHKESWTLTHMFYSNMGGFVLKEDPQSSGPTNGMHHLKLDEFVELLTNEKSSSWFQIEPPRVEEIRDRSKSDGFAKILAIVQIAYFFVDFFARIIEGLPLTQLELAVAAMASYSLASYWLLYHKPKGVNTVIVLKEYSGPLPEELRNFLNKHSNKDSQDLCPKTWTGKVSSFAKAGFSPMSIVTYCLLGVPLGAVHVAAWNFPFPTAADAWLWRVSAIVSAAIGPALLAATGFILVVIYTFASASEASRTSTKTLFWTSITMLFTLLAGLLVVPAVLLMVLAGPMYLGARLTLIVEIVRCLFYLPPEAYLTPYWSGSIPHFS